MIHKYKLGGYNIVLDVHSGAVHVVDELTYDMLDNVSAPFENGGECPENVMEKLSKFYRPSDISACYGELLTLYKEGLLFSADDYERFAEGGVASPIKALCLHIAQDCNLRCEYCFAGTGDFGLGRKVMDTETGIKAINFLIEHSGDRRFLEVDFFGGEPTMNFQTVKDVVAYARANEAKWNKEIRFTITTNGLMLNDEMMEFINREMSNVVLSIDGRKCVNDRVRKRVDGSGCYDKILPLYKKLVDERPKDKDYYVRGTFTKYNLDFSEDVFHLYEAGFDQISVEPVMAPADAPYAWTEAQLPAIFNEYERLAERILEAKKEGKIFNFFHFMLDLDQGPCAIKRLKGCGSGNEYVAITPDGDIYPCHQFVGAKDWLMGNIYTGEFSQSIKEFFAKVTIYQKSECRSCWAKFYCSGGCNANNYFYMGDVKKPHKLSCEVEKKRLECAIFLKAAEEPMDFE